MKFTITKSRAMTFGRSPQCRVFSMDETSLSLLFPVFFFFWGGGVDAQWLQMTGVSGGYHTLVLKLPNSSCLHRE